MFYYYVIHIIQDNKNATLLCMCVYVILLYSVTKGLHSQKNEVRKINDKINVPGKVLKKKNWKKHLFFSN
jgi:hypothetical protein